MNKLSKKELKKLRKLKKDYQIFSIKLVMAGDTRTGKSCALIRYCENIFEKFNPSTIGVDFKSCIINIENMTVKLLIWDTDGNDQQRKTVGNYFQGCAGIFLFYNSSNRRSFENLEEWLNEIRERQIHSGAIKILIGGWSDNEDDKVVSTEEGRFFANVNGFIFIEVSSLTGKNVENMFVCMGRAVLRNLAAGFVNVGIKSNGISLVGEPRQHKN
ncbi:ras-related protein Rab-2A-like [Styela clava]